MRPIIESTTGALQNISNAGTLTWQEQRKMDVLLKHKTLDTELNKMSDLKQAKKRFNSLSEFDQNGLLFQRPDAAYAVADKEPIKRFRDEIIQGLQSPFRETMNALEDVATTFTLPFKAAVDIAAQDGISAKLKRGVEWAKGLPNYSGPVKDAYEHNDQWTSDAKTILENKYGKSMSILVRDTIDGKPLSDTIYSVHGLNDAEFLEAVQAQSDYRAAAYMGVLTPQGKKYKEALDEHKNYQNNWGNFWTNWANSNHPPSKGGVREIVTSLLLGLATPIATIMSGEGPRPNKEKTKWLIANQNPYAKEKYVSPSGELNFWNRLIADPTTYITGFGTKTTAFASEGKQLAEKFLADARNGVPPVERVADVFKNENFRSKHEVLVKAIVGIRDSKVANDVISNAQYNKQIEKEFPGYEPDLINRLVTAKVKNNVNKDVPITDLDTLQRFFEAPEHASYIISGSIHGVEHFRETEILLAKQENTIKDAILAAWDQQINGFGPKAAKAASGAKPFTAKEIQNYANFVDFLNKPVRMGVIDNKKDPILKSINALKKNTLLDAKNLLATHPSSTMIFTSDDLVYKSIDAFKDLVRITIGDKDLAFLIAAHFTNLTPPERMNTLRSVYGLYMDKIGLSATTAGAILKKQELEGIFTPNFAPVQDIKTPKHLERPDIIDLPEGPTTIINTTEGISMLNFNRMHSLLYDRGRATDTFRKYFGLNGALNSVINQALSMALILPDLPLKAVIDESIMKLSKDTPSEIASIFRLEGKQASDALVAYTGSDQTYGMIKSALLSGFKKNPKDFISAAERKQMMMPIEKDISYKLPNGKLLPRKHFVSADEFWGKDFNSRVADRAIAKTAASLSPKRKVWLHELLTTNGFALHGSIKSSIGASMGNSAIDGTMAKEIYGLSPLTKYLDEQGLKLLPDYATDTEKMLSASNRTTVHYAEFFKYFAFDKWNKSQNKVVHFGNLFIKHNALKTAIDGKNYIDDVMTQIGFQKNKLGVWEIQSETARKDILSFVNQFRQTPLMLENNSTLSLITESIVYKHSKELYTLFHGSDEVFNQPLLDYLRKLVANQKKALIKKNNYRLSENALRKYAGQPPIELTPKQILSNKKKITFSGNVEKMPYSDFEALVTNYPLTGILRSNIDFGTAKTSVADRFKNFGEMLWEMSDRQITDVFRSDAFMSLYFKNRENLDADYTAHIRELIADGVDPIHAKQVAKLTATNRATSNAIDELLKYVDNPEIKTQLAWNLRVNGRFYRATEDFAKRYYRIASRNAGKVTFRLMNVQTAMDATGELYTDEKGNEYIVLPNDPVVWRTVVPVLSLMMSPLSILRETAKLVDAGIISPEKKYNWNFYKQPEWNENTLKLSMLNPAYSEGAGVPALFGSSMAASVIGARDFLGRKGILTNPKIQTTLENLDNWILGTQSDDTTLARALIPPLVTSSWAQLDPEIKTGEAVVALQNSALALQLNKNTRLSEEDGLDEKKLNLFYDRMAMGAYNIYTVKKAFNMGYGPTLGSGPVLSEESRRLNFGSPSREFTEILNAVLSVNAREGYPYSDPIFMATQLFVGSHPDKLIFTASKASEPAKMAITVVEETKKWAITNRRMIKKYKEAWIFSPQVGQYSAATFRYLEAADLIPTKRNPFDNLPDSNLSSLKRWIQETTIARERMLYFNTDRELRQRLEDPNNINRNRATSRAALEREAAKKKADMLKASPLLDHIINTESFRTPAALGSAFNNLVTLLNDENFATDISRNLDKKQIDVLKNVMIPLTQRMELSFSDPDVRQQYKGTSKLNDIYRDGMNNLKDISKNNDALKRAFETIIEPYLSALYAPSIKALEKN